MLYNLELYNSKNPGIEVVQARDFGIAK
jgi:hypothetical protein